jgi:N-methylhydantoinase B
MTALDTPAAGFWDGVARSYIPSEPLSVHEGLRLHTAADADVDPITFEVIRYTLLNANFEHSALIQRLCISPIVMLTRDFQASVLLEDGDLMFMGPNLQYFSNSHSLSIKWILENRSESPGIGPDDMYLSNDPYVGAPHQPDTCLSAPVFVDGELFCWVANILHYSDVGGPVPGSFCLTATDMWTDPPSFPPFKIIEGGKLRTDLEQLFLRQSRLPVNVQMDLRAAISANQVTVRRVLDLVERYGPDTVKTVMRRTVDAAEALFVERLQDIPDGTWSHRAYTEAAIPGDRNVYKYQINLHKKGDRIEVDNEGTDPQAGSINITYVAFAGAVLAALTQSMTSDLAGAYGGPHRRVTFNPTPGLLNCAEFPAAVSPSGAYTTEMNLNAAVSAVGKMLSCGGQAARDLILGPCIPHFYSCIYAGLDANGQMFIMPNTNGMMGSIAGMPDRDGVDLGGHFWIPEGIAYNIEQVEAQFPILYLYRRMLDGGHDGAGRTRGGLGFCEATLPWRSQYMEMVLSGNDAFTKAQGQLGSNPGTRAWMRIRSGADIRERFAAGEIPQSLDELAGEDAEVRFKAMSMPVDVETGVFEWCSPSTSGFGDPLRREPTAVAADVDAGLFSPAAAEAIYGVVIGDDAATTARRAALVAERLGRAPSGGPGAPVGARLIGDALCVHDGHWCCACCGTVLAPAAGNYKDGAVTKVRPVDQIAPGFETSDPEMAAKMEFREFLCGGCGVRFDSELARAGDEVLWDIRLA